MTNKIPMTIKIDSGVQFDLENLSTALAGRMGLSFKRWLAEVALPRFVKYERRRVNRRKAQIEREVAELERRARERSEVRKLEITEIREGLATLDKLHTRGEDLTEEEKAKVEETMADLLSRRTVTRLHAQALVEDELRESRKIADRLRASGDLSYTEWERVQRILES